MRLTLGFKGLAAGLVLAAQTIFSAEAAGGRDETATKDWQTWAPYRPGLYFGVRPNVPETMLMGLMWANADDLLNTLRDTCEQDDGMQGYGWTTYDPRVGGSQTIHDKQLGVDLATEFVKNEDGSGWAVRVSGVVRPDAVADVVKTSLIFHVAMEGAADLTKKKLSCERLSGGNGHISGMQCRGEESKLGPFDIRINADPKTNAIKKSLIRSKRVPEEKTWQAKAVFKELIQANEGRDAPGAGNIHFVRFEFEGSFSASFSYRDEPTLHISPRGIVAKLHDLRESFSAQVDQVFPRTYPFRDSRHTTFTQALLSNLLGGLSFSHGDSKISEPHATEDGGTAMDASAMDQKPVIDEVKTTEATSLLSFTPSRPFFPRGFLWDEGFHLLPVLEWDMDLAISVFRSWLELLDEDGWIAREQILGPEARSRVPGKFQVQYRHHANPPTFLALFLPALLGKLTGSSPYHGHPSKYLTSSAERKLLLSELYPSITRHYSWFRRTQAGNFTEPYPRPSDAIPGEGYRWRGRTAQHTLASGLDDYPRAEPPHPGELHVDALAWIGASAKALLQVSDYLQLTEQASVYRGHLEAIQHNLDALHWEDSEGAYCDATVVKSQYQRVCHLGYVSIMPLLLGLMNSSHPHAAAMLDTLSDPGTLWSGQGLRSLSAKDERYGTDEDYWRGAVWVNLNVLAVLRLRDIGLDDQPKPATKLQKKALQLAEELRKNVVHTVYRSYAQTGFVWEQYDDKSGEGKHSRAFTGWTACVLLLMRLGFERKEGGAVGGGGGAAAAAAAAGSRLWSELELSTATRTSSSQMVSTRVGIVAFAVALLVLVFRRRLIRLFGRTASFWRSRRT